MRHVNAYQAISPNLTDDSVNFVAFLEGDFAVYIKIINYLAVIFFDRFILKFVKHIGIQKSVK